jgi:hypothetical protein
MSFFSDSAPSINNDTGQPANNLFQQRFQRIKKTDIREDSSHWEQSFLGDNPIGTVMEKIFPDSHSESDIRTEQIKQTPYSELEPRNTPTLNASDTPKPWVNMYDIGYQVRAKLETLDRKMNELHQKLSTCNQRCITLEQLLTNEMVQIVTQIHSYVKYTLRIVVHFNVLSLGRFQVIAFLVQFRT